MTISERAILFILIFVMTEILVIRTAPLYATTVPLELQIKLQENAAQLQKINDQIAETQRNLSTVSAQSRTIQSELHRIQTSLSQIDLKAKSAELTVAQLGLEIEALTYDIIETEEHIESQRNVLRSVFQDMQQRDNESALMALLRHDTITDIALEAEGMLRVGHTMAAATRDFLTLKINLESALKSATRKRDEQTQERINLQNLKAIAEDERAAQQRILTQTKSQEAVYAQELNELQKRQEEIAGEIEKIEEQMRRTINPELLPSARPGVLLKPVDGRLTQGYGRTSFAISGYTGQWHNGLDFGAPIGTPIRSAESGTVIQVGDQDQYCRRGAYGKYIVIKHDNNLTTLYAHVSRHIVRVGDRVERGTLIGYVGNTGYATGPHLHFTVYESATFSMRPSRTCGPMPSGGDIDPSKYL